MGAATAEIAVVAKLKGGSTDAGTRVYPQVNTQEPNLPFVTVTRQGTNTGNRLSGKRAALAAVTIEVACYAATQAGAVNLAKQVRDLLAPTGAPWVDPTNGVQGCFYQDGAEEVVGDESKDTPRLVRETYLVYHTPT